MKKLVIELCCVIVLAACGNGKEQNTVEEDSTAKALLQGVWIDDETELPLMRIEGDTIYYADRFQRLLIGRKASLPGLRTARKSLSCAMKAVAAKYGK